MGWSPLQKQHNRSIMQCKQHDANVQLVIQANKYQIKADCEQYFHSHWLRAHLHDWGDTSLMADNDPFTKFDNKMSTWTPPDGQLSAKDHYIDFCCCSINSRSCVRAIIISNLPRGPADRRLQLLSGRIIFTIRRHTTNCGTTVFTYTFMLIPHKMIRKSSKTPSETW